MVSYYYTSKKNIELKIDNQKINVVLRNIFSKTMKITTDNNKKYIEILQDSLNYPVFLFPNQNTHSIFILYWFDIEVHAFSIVLNKDILNMNAFILNQSLQNIIISTKGFEVKSLTQKDINDMINTIDKLPNHEYEKFSVPSLDLGLYKKYISKKRIIELLKNGLDTSTNINSNIMQSKINHPW
jgi:hypothetical protein